MNQKLDSKALDKVNIAPAAIVASLNKKFSIIFECNDGKVNDIKYDYKKIDIRA